MIESLLQAEHLLVMGMLDEAEALYRRSAEADPLNAIAVVGLARVALERGDERLAYERACAALEIDPDDAMALRMEARLSEVLAARGEPVERPRHVTRGVPANRQPAGSAPGPPASGAGDAAAVDLAAQAQRSVAARNPSMAEHAARDGFARRPREEPPREPASVEDPPVEPVRVETGERRPSLLRRILRR